MPTVAIAILLAYFLELTPFPKVEAYIRTLILYPIAMSFIVTYGGPGISTDVLALNMWVTTFQQHLVSAGALKG